MKNVDCFVAAKKTDIYIIKKRSAVLLTAFPLSMSLIGCSIPSELVPEISEERIIRSDQDEICLSDWEFSEGGVQAALRFEGDKANLSLTSGDISDEICGLAVIDNGTFIIFDNNDKYMFDYKLTGDKLTLGYEGEEAEFFRN